MHPLILFNPNSGSLSPSVSQSRLQTKLRSLDCPFDLYETRPTDSVRELAQRAAQQGYDCVVAAGGDGMVNLTASGLIGTGVPLGIIPIGTANVMAAELGIPNDIEQSCQVIAADHTVRCIDIGGMNDRYFLLRASTGFETHMVKGAQRELKARVGQLAYLLAAMREAARPKPARYRLTIDGRVFERNALGIIIANSGSMGSRNPLRLGRGMTLDDHMLDVMVLCGDSVLETLLETGQALMAGQGHEFEQVYLRGREIQVETDSPLEVQVDGEMVGHTPFRAWSVEQGLHVIVPRDA